MKSYCLVIILSLFHQMGLTQDAQIQDTISLELAELESGATDSLGLERIITHIENTSSDPRLSLRYIALYETIVSRNPEIPNRIERVLLLKGSRYNGLAWSYNMYDAEMSFLYLDSSLLYYDSVNSEAGYYQDQYGRGVTYRYLGENRKALEYFDRYYRFYKENRDSARIANVQYQRGCALTDLGELDAASTALDEAIRLDEAMGRMQSLAFNLNILAINKKRAKLYDQVPEIYERSIDIQKNSPYRQDLTYTIMNYGNFLLSQKKMKAAKEKYMEAISTVREDDVVLSYVYENLSTWYLQNEMHDSALHYIQHSLAINDRSGNPRESMIALHHLGEVQWKRKNYKEAIESLETGLKIARDLSNLTKQSEISQSLAEVYSERGDFENAHKILKINAGVKDSLLNRDIAKAVEETEVKYETEKNKQEITLLSAKNALIDQRLAASRRQNQILILGAFFLVGFLVWFFSLNNKLRQAIYDKNILLKEIHHRVKNNLQVISALLSLQSRYDNNPVVTDALAQGQNRVQSIALIHKNLYQHDNLKGVDTEDYFNRLIEHIFDTYKLSNQEVELEIDIMPLNLDVDTMVPLGLIVNELITNSLKHAFPDGGPGRIKISLREENDHLYLSVADNGVGQVVKRNRKSSFGQSLVESLGQKLEAKTMVKSENGYVVQMEISEYKKSG